MSPFIHMLSSPSPFWNEENNSNVISNFIANVQLRNYIFYNSLHLFISRQHILCFKSLIFGKRSPKLDSIYRKIKHWFTRFAIRLPAWRYSQVKSFNNVFYCRQPIWNNMCLFCSSQSMECIRDIKFKYHTLRN